MSKRLCENYKNKIINRIKSPNSLKNICITSLVNKEIYKNNFIKYNMILPSTIKNMLIQKLFNTDEHTNENADVNIVDWFQITEKQFINLLYIDRNSFYKNRSEIIWKQINGQCCYCNDNYQTYYKINTADCYDCGCSCDTLTADCKEINSIIFNRRNWCNKCYVKPLFNILQETTVLCKRCNQINSFY